VKDEQSTEYKQRLALLDEKFAESVAIAQKLRQFQTSEAQLVYESEQLAADQDHVDKLACLRDRLLEEVETKIDKLKHDKHQVCTM